MDTAYTGCFHVLAVVNYAAMNMGVNVIFQVSVSLFLFFGKYPEVEWLNHMVVPFSVLRTLIIVFCKGYTNVHSHQ